MPVPETSPTPQLDGGTRWRRVEDDAGRPVDFGMTPRRIISLVPSATDILLALGQREALVGRTDFDRDPGLASLPSVGGGIGPSSEMIIALRPDLVIRFSGPSDRATATRLDDFGVTHLAVRPDGIEDVFRIVDLLGRVVDRTPAADSIVIRLRAELDEVSADAATRARPEVAILLGGDPPLVAGRGTFLHELVEVAGGRNVLSDRGELYTPTSVEEIVRRAPELLLVSEGALLPEALAHLPVRRIPSEVEIPGIAMGASARRLFTLLHEAPLP